MSFELELNGLPCGRVKTINRNLFFFSLSGFKDLLQSTFSHCLIFPNSRIDIYIS